MLLARDHQCYAKFYLETSTGEHPNTSKYMHIFPDHLFCKNEYISNPSCDFSGDVAKKKAAFLGVRRDQFNYLFSGWKHRKTDLVR